MESQINSIISNESLSKKEQFDLLRKLFNDSGVVGKKYVYCKARMLIDPEYKKATYACTAKYTKNRKLNDPEFRKLKNRQSGQRAVKRYNSNEAYREKQKELSRERYNSNEEYRERKICQALERYYKNKENDSTCTKSEKRIEDLMGALRI